MRVCAWVRKSEHSLMCFCPHSAGVDLFYKDKASAPGQPLLFGAALPWDFSEVFTPGGWAPRCNQRQGFFPLLRTCTVVFSQRHPKP